MGIKKRQQGKTRLSGRNTLEALNDLIHLMNPVLPKTQRIQPVKTPRDLCTLRQKVKTLSPVKSTDGSRSKTSIQKVEALPNSIVQALSTIATNAWRAKNKMLDAETGEVKDEMKRVYRHVEALFDALNQIGIEVRDMQGRPYDSGMALKVVCFEPTPGLYKEKITETIKPTIARRGQLIQIGEVIVGTPQAR